MSVIEALLRLGCSMVAWMVIYTHCIWLATLRVTGCTDGDELWRLLLGFAPITLLFCLLLGSSHKLVEVHRILRWFATPLVILIPLGLVTIWPSLLTSSIDGQAICATDATALEAGTVTPSWHIWWAPLQIGTLICISVTAIRNWHLTPKTQP